ncbi:glycosyltransferase [Botrimarina sp.]|uniref:glycosyltransferase n=1 Tax=Botrimarina sp. TaxID=2795802 RepID=UPI0032EB545D
MKPNRISVVLSTYNQPEWLDKTLAGYAVQDAPPDEVLIADDGSADATGEVIERHAATAPFPLRRLWQEDRGFRKCRALNEAILAATGDYLIFSDGDCVPRRDFVSVHRRLAAEGCFLSGGYYKLQRDLSELISDDDIRSGRAFDYRWLRSEGLRPDRHALRLWAGPLVALCSDLITTTRPTWNGNNASAFRTALIAAGGFDERMRYGGLDRELGERLVNAGLRGVQIRNRAVCLHLDHPRGYANEQDWKNNHAIRAETRLLRRRRTDHGIPAAA